MFSFSLKFDWSFSHFPKFNWRCCTLPKCCYFTQMFLILPKTLLKFCSWPKYDEGCWNYHMIPVHSRAMSLCHQDKKEWQNSLRLFWKLFWKKLLKKLKIVSQIMVNFSALGMRPHPHSVRLWASGPYMAYHSLISGPRMHSGKIFKSEICWNAFEVMLQICWNICLTELLALDNVHLHKNNE